MSFEKALIASTSPSMVAAKIQAKINPIISSGCIPHIVEYPVALEPKFQSIWGNNTEESQNQDHYVIEQPLSENDLIRKRIWISHTCGYRFDRIRRGGGSSCTSDAPPR